MDVMLVVRYLIFVREASAFLKMLSAKQGSPGAISKVFRMAQLRINLEPPA